jgi:hypothetical protein
MQIEPWSAPAWIPKQWLKREEILSLGLLVYRRDFQ